jgi:hypothetical protein
MPKVGLEEQAMRINVGTTDRIVRVAIGLALVAYALPLGVASVGWHWVGLVGMVLILTALFRNCPLYEFLGFSTCQVPAPNRNKAGSAG